MKTEKFSGTIENAYGTQLAKPVKFEGSFEAYESIEDVKNANDFPSNDEIVAFVNTRRKNNARQKSMTSALEAAGITKPTLEDTPELQLKTMVKSMVASGKYTEEKATELAKQILGL